MTLPGCPRCGGSGVVQRRRSPHAGVLARVPRVRASRDHAGRRGQSRPATLRLSMVHH